VGVSDDQISIKLRAESSTGGTGIENVAHATPSLLIIRYFRILILILTRKWRDNPARNPETDFHATSQHYQKE
jgi:hypothetical protein